jgi:hypothetical protein
MNPPHRGADNAPEPLRLLLALTKSEMPGNGLFDFRLGYLAPLFPAARYLGGQRFHARRLEGTEAIEPYSDRHHRHRLHPRRI